VLFYPNIRLSDFAIEKKELGSADPHVQWLDMALNYVLINV